MSEEDYSITEQNVCKINVHHNNSENSEREK